MRTVDRGSDATELIAACAVWAGAGGRFYARSSSSPLRRSVGRLTDEGFRRPDSEIDDRSERLRVTIPNENEMRAEVARLEGLLADPTFDLGSGQARWEAARQADVDRWTVLTPEDVESRGGAASAMIFWM